MYQQIASNYKYNKLYLKKTEEKKQLNVIGRDYPKKT